jgi:hypothetical protein
MTTYTKLNDGTWGLWSTDALQPGATVGVTTRDGSIQTVTVDRILRSSNGVTIATKTDGAMSTVSERRKTRRRRAGAFDDSDFWK